MHDKYCAICGACLIHPGFYRRPSTPASEQLSSSSDQKEKHETRSDPGEEADDWYKLKFSYDPDVVSPEEARWTGTVQALAFNPDAEGLTKCYLTGTGVYDVLGYVYVSRGDDPNAPEEEIWNGLNHQCFTGVMDDEAGVVFPFHPECFDILCRCLKYHESIEIDKDLLYAQWSGIASYDHLDISYGELLQDQQEQYWMSYRGEEVLVANPYNITKLDGYLDRFPTLEKSRSKLDLQSKVKRDPFNRLPFDVFFLICKSLDPLSIVDFQVASWAAYSQDIPNAHWQDKIKEQCPWFWEVARASSDLDFKKLILDLTRKSTYDYQRIGGEQDKSVILGLVNRLRIWQVCELLRDVYLDDYFDNEEAEDQSMQFIKEHSTSLQMPRTLLPDNKSDETESAFWIRSWKEVDYLGSTLTIYWNFHNSLMGLGLTIGGHQRLFGRSDAVFFLDVNHMSIPPNDWITGIVLNISGRLSKSLDPMSDEEKSAAIKGIKVILRSGTEKKFGDFRDGHKRKLAVSQGKTLVGIIGQLDQQQKAISRLGLLECAREEDVDTQEPATKIPQADSMLWQDELLPSPSIRALPYQTGYWAPDPPIDFVPQQALLFGLDEDKLRMLTGISVCVPRGGTVTSGSERRNTYDIAGVRAEYGPESSSKEIGSCMEAYMQHFDIDGPGGEFITEIEVGMNELPKALRFRTNRGRTSPNFGNPQENSHDTQTPPYGERIVGIAIAFGNKSGYSQNASGETIYTHARATTVCALTMAMSSAESLDDGEY